LQEVGMRGDSFEVDGGLNSTGSPMLMVETSIEN